jgi:hypothetical protein
VNNDDELDDVGAAILNPNSALGDAITVFMEDLAIRKVTLPTLPGLTFRQAKLYAPTANAGLPRSRWGRRRQGPGRCR